MNKLIRNSTAEFLMFTTLAGEERINAFVLDQERFEVTDWHFKFGEVRA